MLIYIGILLSETQDYPMIILFHHCENFRMNTLWRCLTCSVYSTCILIFFFLTDFKPFPAFGKRTVSLRKGDPSVPAAFLREGLVPCAPHLPTVAITIRVLKLYRNASLRCPHLAINSFVKALSDLHGIPFHPYLRKQFSICFDVYLSIRNRIDLRIQTALKRDDPGWRLRHACPACTYKLTGEAELEFSMLVTMDGNDSLKRVQRRKQAPIDPGDGDAPVVGEPNEREDERNVGAGYYMTREQVDRWNRDTVLEWIKEHEKDVVSCFVLFIMFFPPF